jgi:hypothetical protein
MRWLRPIAAAVGGVLVVLAMVGCTGDPDEEGSADEPVETSGEIEVPAETETAPAQRFGEEKLEAALLTEDDLPGSWVHDPETEALDSDLGDVDPPRCAPVAAAFDLVGDLAHTADRVHHDEGGDLLIIALGSGDEPAAPLTDLRAAVAACDSFTIGGGDDLGRLRYTTSPFPLTTSGEETVAHRHTVRGSGREWAIDVVVVRDGHHLAAFSYVSLHGDPDRDLLLDVITTQLARLG